MGDLPDFLDKRDRGYLIKVKLKGLVFLLETQNQEKVKGQPGWEGREFSHQLWDLEQVKKIHGPTRGEKCAILSYNTLHWMALCSGNAILRRREPATRRTYLVRMAGNWTCGARQQKLRVLERTLYNAQWNAWIAVGETRILCFTPEKTFC